MKILLSNAKYSNYFLDFENGLYKHLTGEMSVMSVFNCPYPAITGLLRPARGGGPCRQGWQQEREAVLHAWAGNGSTCRGRELARICTDIRNEAGPCTYLKNRCTYIVRENVLAGRNFKTIVEIIIQGN